MSLTGIFLAPKFDSWTFLRPGAQKSYFESPLTFLKSFSVKKLWTDL